MVKNKRYHNITKQNKARTYWPSARESTSDQWIPHHKGSVMQKALAFYGVIVTGMYCLIASPTRQVGVRGPP